MEMFCWLHSCLFPPSQSVQGRCEGGPIPQDLLIWVKANSTWCNFSSNIALYGFNNVTAVDIICNKVSKNFSWQLARLRHVLCASQLRPALSGCRVESSWMPTARSSNLAATMPGRCDSSYNAKLPSTSPDIATTQRAWTLKCSCADHRSCPGSLLRRACSSCQAIPGSW